MKNPDKQKKGFSIIELLIVVLIIGIIASFAIPGYIDATKRAKEAEARSILSTIRSSQMRYYAEYGIYNDDGDLTDGTNSLDISITPSRYYEYKAYSSILFEFGNNIIGSAIPHAGTGLRRLYMDLEGNLYFI